MFSPLVSIKSISESGYMYIKFWRIETIAISTHATLRYMLGRWWSILLVMTLREQIVYLPTPRMRRSMGQTAEQTALWPNSESWSADKLKQKETLALIEARSTTKTQRLNSRTIVAFLQWFSNFLGLHDQDAFLHFWSTAKESQESSDVIKESSDVIKGSSDVWRHQKIVWRH